MRNSFLLGMGVVLSLGVAACGGSDTTDPRDKLTGWYSGSMTTAMAGAATGTDTQNGFFVLVDAAATANELVLVFDQGLWLYEPPSGVHVMATLSGTSLTMNPSQTFSNASGTTSETYTVTGGNGSVSGNNLSLTLNFSDVLTSTATSNYTYTLTYSGTKQ